MAAWPGFWAEDSEAEDEAGFWRYDSTWEDDDEEEDGGGDDEEEGEPEGAEAAAGSEPEDAGEQQVGGCGGSPGERSSLRGGTEPLPRPPRAPGAAPGSCSGAAARGWPAGPNRAAAAVPGAAPLPAGALGRSGVRWVGVPGPIALLVYSGPFSLSSFSIRNWSSLKYLQQLPGCCVFFFFFLS